VTDRPPSHIPSAEAVGEGGAPSIEGAVDQPEPGPGNGGVVDDVTDVTSGAGHGGSGHGGSGNGGPGELAAAPWGPGPDLGQDPGQDYEVPEDGGYDGTYDGAYDDAVEGHGYAMYEDGDEDASYDGSYEQSFEEPEEQVYDAPPRRRSGSSETRRRRRRRFVVGLGVVVAVLVVIGIVGFIRVSHDIHPTGEPGHAVSVSIPNGASTAKIGDELAKAGVIHGPLVFELYVKLEGAGPFMPGTYRLATNQPYSSVVYSLEKGPPPVIDKLVVPEGFTIRQIAAAVGRLRGIGISSQAFMEAATSGQVRSPYEPASTDTLEGFLFPATYPVQRGETADDLVQYMVDTFDHYASQLDLSGKAAQLHYSPYQVLEVASIVEREAKFESDRGLIASAIYNRLAGGMPIGAESTLLYALGNPKGPVNMETRSPYNTLIHRGLPPTPISNPGIPSLQAAMSPAKTDYLFWVEVNPDGKMGYASDEAGFSQLEVECKKAHLC
jgi:UPF0755 protein